MKIFCLSHAWYSLNKLCNIFDEAFLFYVSIFPRFISLTMHGVQSVAVIIDFIYGQNIFFKSCDCRSEGVVPTGTWAMIAVCYRYRIKLYRFNIIETW